MAGIYIHIPFCKQACHYCNFHFSTSLKYKGDLLQALMQELELQRQYLPTTTLETVYLGGGTPSLLTGDELQRLFDTIGQWYDIAADAEITLEANPDDLTDAKIREFRTTPINRFSIGIQSFAEADLQFMNRAHNAQEALLCIQKVQDAGFENLTVDLIYGTPTLSDEQWQANMQQVIDFQIPHISCYALTVEEKTALAHFVKTGKVHPVDEEQAARQFEQLMQKMQANGYEHYEISNFAKPGRYARHNSNYWKGVPYLGIGPSAHSYNGQSRQWNVANNALYIKSLQKGKVPFEREELTPEQQYDEYVMTGLRTIWGVDLEKVRSFGSRFERHFLKNIQHFILAGQAEGRGDTFYLTEKGKLLADGIAMELFFE